MAILDEIKKKRAGQINELNQKSAGQLAKQRLKQPIATPGRQLQRGPTFAVSPEDERRLTQVAAIEDRQNDIASFEASKVLGIEEQLTPFRPGEGAGDPEIIAEQIAPEQGLTTPELEEQVKRAQAGDEFALSNFITGSEAQASEGDAVKGENILKAKKAIPGMEKAIKQVVDNPESIGAPKLKGKDRAQVEQAVKDPQSLKALLAATGKDKPSKSSSMFLTALVRTLPLLLGEVFEEGGGVAAFEVSEKVRAGLISEEQAGRQLQLEEQKVQQDQAKAVASNELALAKFEESKEQFKTTVGLKNKELSLKSLASQAKIDDKQLPRTVVQRKEKLSNESKKRFDNVTLSLKSLKGMASAMAAGDNTFSLVGDNDFTLNKGLFAEAIGRMQSGGAINDKEAVRFMGFVPNVKDSAEMQQTKLKQLTALMTDRLTTLGFNPGELGIDTEVDIAVLSGGRPAASLDGLALPNTAIANEKAVNARQTFTPEKKKRLAELRAKQKGL